MIKTSSKGAMLLIALLISALYSGGIMADTVSNYISNSSVEIDSNSNSNPDGWSTAWTGSFTWDNTAAQEGTYSLKINNSTGNAAWYSTKLPIAPANQYSLSGWVKTQSATGATYIRLSWFDSNNSWITSTDSSSISGTEDWTLQTITVTPPANAATVAIYCRSDNNSGSAWFDNLTLRLIYNPIINPSVEIDADTDNTPDDWNTFWTASFTWDNTNSHGGAYSLKINNSTGTSGWGSSAIPVVLNDQYTFSAWVKTANATGQTYLRLSWLDANDDWVSSCDSNYISGTNDWSLLSVTAAPPANAAKVMVYCRSDNNSGSAWFDDMLLNSSFVPNYSAEIDDDSDTNPDDWSTAWTGTFTWDNTVAQEGTYSLKINNSSSTSAWYSTKLTIDPTNQYTASGWIKTQSATGTNYIRLSWFDMNDTWLSSTDSSSMSGTADWTLQTITATPPANAAKVAIYCRSDSNSGSAWFDNIKLLREPLNVDFTTADPNVDDLKIGYGINVAYGDEYIANVFTELAAIAKYIRVWVHPNFEDPSSEMNLSNPSIETDADSDSNPDDWTSVWAGNFTWDNTISHSGTYSLKIDSSTSTAAWGNNVTLAVTSTKQYTVSAWVKTASATGQSYMRLSWLDSSDSWISSSNSSYISGTNDWNLLSVTATPPANAAKVMVYCRSDNNSGSAWFDDIRLTEWDFTGLDNYISDVFDAGSKPYITILCPSYMAENDQAKNKPEYYEEFALYCKLIANHYKTLYSSLTDWNWEVWNEPNPDISATDYTNMYNIVEPAIHAVDSTTSVGGPTVSYLTKWSSYHETFLANADVVDFLSYHSYGHYALNTPDDVLLDTTYTYYQDAKEARADLDAYRPGNNVKIMISELNSCSAFSPNTDPRIKTQFNAAWYSSALNYLIRSSSIDIELFFDAFGSFGLMRTPSASFDAYPSYYAKKMICQYFPVGKTVFSSTIVGDANIETLAVSTSTSDNVLLINKTNRLARAVVNIETGSVISSISAYVVDETSTGIQNKTLPAKNVQYIDLEPYAVMVLKIEY